MGSLLAFFGLSTGRVAVWLTKKGYAFGQNAVELRLDDKRLTTFTRDLVEEYWGRDDMTGTEIKLEIRGKIKEYAIALGKDLKIAFVNTFFNHMIEGELGGFLFEKKLLRLLPTEADVAAAEAKEKRHIEKKAAKKAAKEQENK